MRRSPDQKRGAPGSIDADRLAGLRMMDVSRETEMRLALYVDLLRRWQSVKNLVGPSTLAQVWTRHIADSAQLLPLVPTAARWIDMGSGAGFPGLVVAIQLQGLGVPGAAVHLIESNGRKCAFLREVIREIGCPALVHDARVEAVIGSIEDVDVVTSRALAPLPDLLEMGKSPMSKGASGMFLKTAAELDALDPRMRDATWAIAPSRTSAEGRIVMIASPYHSLRHGSDHHSEERSAS